MSPTDSRTRNENDYALRINAHGNLIEAIKHVVRARVELSASAWHGARQVRDHAIMLQRDADELLASLKSLEKIVQRDRARFKIVPIVGGAKLADVPTTEPLA